MKYKVLDLEVDISEAEAVSLRDRYLQNYVYLDRVAAELTADMALKAMCLELDGRGRVQIISRLYGIYSKFRREDERDLLGLNDV